MSDEDIKIITKSASNFATTFVDNHLLPHINFDGHSLINNNISISKKVINLYILYTLGSWLRNWITDFTWSNCLFGSVKLTNNADPDKYKYSGYGIAFDSSWVFSFTDWSLAKNVITFGAHKSSSVYFDNKSKDISILVKNQHKD